jgi:hypothetical protein
MVARVLAVIALFIVINSLTGGLFDQEAPYSTGLLGSALLATALYVGGIVVLVYVFRRFVDRRSWASLRLTGPAGKAWRETGLGLLVGVGLMGAIFAIQLAAGFITVEEVRWETLGVGVALAALLVVVLMEGAAGFTEELVFRGYVFQNVGEKAPLWLGVPVVTFVFAVLHVGNTGFGFWWVLGVFVIAAFFVATRLATGALWFAIGFHAAWNIAQYGVFGLGNVADPPEFGYALVAVEQTGPSWLVGVGQSIEGGLVVYGVVLLALLVILVRRPSLLADFGRRLDADGEVVRR